MKKLLILFVVVGMLACQQQESLMQTDIGKNLFAKTGDALPVRDFLIKSPCFLVQVLEISDSRCPMDAICIWAGEASVRFKIEANEFSLKIGELKEFAVGKGNFRITLKDVVPYPAIQNSDQKKQAVFVISRI